MMKISSDEYFFGDMVIVISFVSLFGVRHTLTGLFISEDDMLWHVAPPSLIKQKVLLL